MPRIPRKFVFDPTEVGVYHCINRCVRRAFLCGTDEVSGKCFDHRKGWIQSRLEFLACQFAVEVLGFAIMSNHIHVVVRNRPDVVPGWSDEEASRRWWNIFPQRKDIDDSPAEPNDAELGMVTSNPERLAEVRKRLSSISWFMRCLVEPIARRANKEDVCSGRFFEGRYRCQPILDETALAACLAYVDLNPIRAGMAETLETSRFTSVYERIQALRKTPSNTSAQRAAWLSPFELVEDAPQTETLLSPGERGAGGEGAVELNESALRNQAPLNDVPASRVSNKGCLPMTFAEYLQLLDWTGRQPRADKPGVIPQDLAPVLERLQLSGDGWLNLVCDFRRKFRRAAGTPASLTKEAAKRGCRKMHGIAHSRAIFDPPSRVKT